MEGNIELAGVPGLEGVDIKEKHLKGHVRCGKEGKYVQDGHSLSEEQDGQGCEERL